MYNYIHVHIYIHIHVCTCVYTCIIMYVHIIILLGHFFGIGASGLNPYLLHQHNTGLFKCDMCIHTTCVIM